MNANDAWPEQWLRPDGLPAEVGAVATTRAGGCSAVPYDTMNLGSHVGDDPAAVAGNRARLAQLIGAQPVYLEQVHGRDVVRLSSADLQRTPRADGCVTTERGLACCVMTADCLPVLFAAPAGRGVAAAHAGWRGLAAGVLEATLLALCEAAGCEPQEVAAWMGPAIGPQRFEVGADVLEAFGASAAEPGSAFVAGRAGHWCADLPALARRRLSAAGLARVGGGLWCTVGDARFYSFRRDRVTGRMASCIWIR
ncbi:MAG: peptidoglycan editing factor PgeF [Aquabacterium sp.]|nr:MAG: peptidoglycan editing factor PgeF [Aquabacterium sp.]